MTRSIHTKCNDIAKGAPSRLPLFCILDSNVDVIERYMYRRNPVVVVPGRGKQHRKRGRRCTKTEFLGERKMEGAGGAARVAGEELGEALTLRYRLVSLEAEAQVWEL